MADSSTEATPSITSPSAGMKSPASTRKTSPFTSRVEGVSVTGPVRTRPGSFFAITSRLADRSASACALLRPSAIASAKLAKSTVIHSHSDDGEDESGRRLALARERLDPEDRREDAAQVHDEHHGVAPLVLRQQLHERIAQRPAEDGRRDELAQRRVRRREGLRDGNAHGFSLALSESRTG